MDTHAMRFEITGVRSDEDHWVLEGPTCLFGDECVLAVADV
jgi:hypothetical protein